jgi:hypothetical protein
MNAIPHCDFRHSILSRKCLVVPPQIVFRNTNAPECLKRLFARYFRDTLAFHIKKIRSVFFVTNISQLSRILSLTSRFSLIFRIWFTLTWNIIISFNCVGLCTPTPCFRRQLCFWKSEANQNGVNKKFSHKERRLLKRKQTKQKAINRKWEDVN